MLTVVEYLSEDNSSDSIDNSCGSGNDYSHHSSGDSNSSSSSNISSFDSCSRHHRGKQPSSCMLATSIEMMMTMALMTSTALTTFRAVVKTAKERKMK